jgi:glycosyltransferase involved in cell wall biosynthesis
MAQRWGDHACTGYAKTGMKLLVITPTLGTSRFLEETCASVGAITVQHRHLLVCPGGEIARLRQRFQSCEVLADEGAAGGLYGALNVGIKAAGDDWDWFTYVNDDDRLGRDFSRYAKTHFETGDECVAGFGDVRLLDEAGRRLGLMSVERDARRWVALLDAGISPVSQQGMLFSRRLVNSLAGYNPGWRLCGDQDFWLRAFRAGFAFRHRAGEVGCFRIRRGQLSGAVSEVRCEMAAITRVHFPEMTLPAARAAAWGRFRLRNALRVTKRALLSGGKSNARLLASETSCKAAGRDRRPVLINGLGCVEAGSRGVLRELMKMFPPERRAWLLMPASNREDVSGVGRTVRVLGLNHRVFGRWLRPLLELGLYLTCSLGCFSRVVNVSSYGWCARGRTPTVLYFHNALLVEDGYDRWSGEGGRPNGLKRWYLDTCLKRAEKVVVQSESMAERLVAYARRRRLEPRAIEVVQPLWEFSAKSPRAPKTFAFQFFYPASGFPHKRVELAMEAAIVANREDARIGLVITASPVVSAPKAALRTIGVISHEAALGHFAVSDALLFTSSRESLGFPLLEALHFGLPAVLPPLPCARAIYGDAGVYFESDEVAAVAAAMLACVRAREALSEKVAVRREHVRSGGVTWAEHWKKFGLL